MEYLSADDAKGCVEFSKLIEEAVVFPSHGLADDRAARMRVSRPDLGFVFAVSCTPPLPAADEVSRSHGGSRRGSRRERLEAEMRADDLRQLEEEEVYG